MDKQTRREIKAEVKKRTDQEREILRRMWQQVEQSVQYMQISMRRVERMLKKIREQSEF